MRRVAISLFAFLLLALFGCERPTIIRVAVPHPRVLGFAYCTPAGSAAFVNINVLDTIDLIGTVRHEKKHLEQMRRFTSCAEFIRWSNTPGNRARMEAEAFCEEVKHETPTYGYVFSVFKYAQWLSTGYPSLRLTVDDAQKLIREFC